MSSQQPEIIHIKLKRDCSTDALFSQHQKHKTDYDVGTKLSTPTAAPTNLVHVLR